MVKSNSSHRGGARKIKKIYLDYAGSALFQSANPGAIHEFGLKEKNKLESARKIIANILGARNGEIIFTSGATESNNLAILGLVKNFKKPHIITTNIEHSSVLEVFRYLEKTRQVEVTYIEVEPAGIVDPRKIKKMLKQNTVLVSVQYANNEIGTVQPLQEIAKEIRYFNKINKQKIFFHTDAVQAVNYLPVKVEKLGVDLMSLNGAKIYGPKGIGILYIKKNTPISQIMFGGEQEFGLRPGTENVALAVELAKALENVEKVKEKEIKRLVKLRNYFISKLLQMPFKIILNGDSKLRLPNNVNITVPKIPSDLLVIELSSKGILISAKSACKSSRGEGSYVIQAIRPETDTEIGGLRFSLGRDTTKQDIDYTIKALSKILQKLKKWYN